MFIDIERYKQRSGPDKEKDKMNKWTWFFLLQLLLTGAIAPLALYKASERRFQQVLFLGRELQRTQPGATRLPVPRLYATFTCQSTARDVAPDHRARVFLEHGKYVMGCV